MKPQPIQHCWPTERLLAVLGDEDTPDGAKIGIAGLAITALQLTASVGACGLLHWVMS